MPCLYNLTKSITAKAVSYGSTQDCGNAFRAQSLYRDAGTYPRKSNPACSIASVPVRNAPSSTKKRGEWLLGAVSGSWPSGVAPKKK